MAGERILITGGAGFIGCHLARALLARGDTVRIMDSMIDQVHAAAAPDPILQHVELVKADIRDPLAVERAVQTVDAVVHLAAEVGVGQSMYAIERYVGVNDLGTAILLEALIAHPVRRLVIASSMSVYGEGLYHDADGNPVDQARRGDRAKSGAWDPVDTLGRPLTPVPTPESKRPALASVYAITKFVQEQLAMTVGPAYGMETAALRMFNVYGPGQALSNPYTGVLAIFAAALLNDSAPQVFEDGEQRRDFVHVEDIARAFVLALTAPAAAGKVFNIGSGQPVTVGETAQAIAAAMDRPDIRPTFLNKARIGDVRHCFADISLARSTLGYEPKRTFADSLGELAEWVRSQQSIDRIAEARQELETRGLVA